jgi:hypothetical protein
LTVEKYIIYKRFIHYDASDLLRGSTLFKTISLIYSLLLRLCLTEAVCMVMSSVCKWMSFWWEAGAGVRRAQGALRQLTSSKVPGRMGIRHHEQGTAFPSNGVFFSLSITHLLLIFMFVCLIKRAPCAG